MNANASPEHGWSLRISNFIQSLSEWIILVLLIGAVCAVAAPLNGIPYDAFMPPGWSAGLKYLILIWWSIVFLPFAWLAYRNFWAGQGFGLIQKGMARPAFSAILSFLALVFVVTICILPILYKDFGEFLKYALTLNQSIDAFSPIAVFPLIVLLILVRNCRRPIWFHMLAILILGGAFLDVYLSRIRPDILEIRKDFQLSPMMSALMPGMMVSCLIMPLRTTLVVLVPFLLSLYVVRRSFAWWKVAVAWLAGYLVLYGVLEFSLPPLNRAMPVYMVLNAALIFFMLRLPIQCRAMERFTGIRFGGEPAERACGDGALSSLLGHSLLIGLVLGIGFFSYIGVYERKTFQVITKGLPAPYRSPSLVNAYDILKPFFVKQKSPTLDVQWSDDLNFMHSVRISSREAINEIRPLVDFAKVEDDVNRHNPTLAAYIKASGADYCLFHEPDRQVTPSFVNLRIVARALLARANTRMMQNRPTEALVDLETNFKIAWLMNGDPNGSLVAHMIAVAIRGLAIGGASNYYYYYRNDPAALDLLRAFLERNAHLVHIDFPSENLQRTEPGFWPVNPYFEIMVPGIVQAGTTFYSRWADYDTVLIATALEAYRRDNGKYPDALDQLAPKYLGAVPKEPLNGASYGYRNLGADFVLSYPTMKADKKNEGEFASAPKEDEYMKTCLENLKANKAKPRSAAATKPASRTRQTAPPGKRVKFVQ